MRERQRHTRGTGASTTARRGVRAIAVTVALIAAWSVPGPAEIVGRGGAAEASAATSASSHVRAAARKREARRAQARKRLRRTLRRSPRSFLRAGFLKQARVAGLRMPVTVRLREPCLPASNPTGGTVDPGGALTPGGADGGLNCAAQGTAVNERDGTTLGVEWNPTRFPLDGALFPARSGEQTLRLVGSFPMVIDFDAGPGYGGPGNLQARAVPGGTITAAGPLVMADLAGCAGTPPPFVEAATGGGAPIAASVASPSWVDLNPFAGTSDGYLDLKLSVRSRVLGSSASCALPGASADYDVPSTAVASDPWNTPVRIRWDGGFRIAPSIAADGAVRLGKMVVSASGAPQAPTSGNLWGCAARTAITGAGLPVNTPCVSASAPPLGEVVEPAPYPATLTLKTLSADVLLGDAG